MLKYGIVGKKLINNKLPSVLDIYCNLMSLDQTYDVLEFDSEIEVAEFIKSAPKKGYKGLNISYPYQQIAYRLMDELSEEALKTGIVNTCLYHEGKIKGFNTEYYGFLYTLNASEYDIEGRKAVVLGNGASAATVKAVLKDLNASQVISFQRDKNKMKIKYPEHTVMDEDEILNVKQVEVFVNCTPTGMFPDTGSCPVSVDMIDCFEWIIDLVYNPWDTMLIKNARKLGKYTQNGMLSVVYQAIKSQEIWNGSANFDIAEDIFYNMKRESGENIVLIGMPGSGKSSVGKALAKSLSMEFFDTDEYIERFFGDISEFFDIGEDYFREVETKVLKRIVGSNGLVISTGGGVVTKKENIDLLKKTGKVFFLDRSPELLIQNSDLKNRPLLSGSNIINKVMNLYNQRIELYKKAADVRIDNNQGIFQAVRTIKAFSNS